MSGACTQELCLNWTGSGCICVVMGLGGVCGPCASDSHEHCASGDSDVCCCGEGKWVW